MLALPDTLTYPQALAAASSLSAQIANQDSAVVIDARALTEFDSSTLAVLLASRRAALIAGKGFSVTGMPAQLRQLASLYGVAELIPATA